MNEKSLCARAAGSYLPAGQQRSSRHRNRVRLEPVPPNPRALLPSPFALVLAQLLAEAEVWAHLPASLLHVPIRGDERPRWTQMKQQRERNGAGARHALVAVYQHAATAIGELPLNPRDAPARLNTVANVSLDMVGNANVVVSQALRVQMPLLGAVHARRNAELLEQPQIRRRLAIAQPQVWQDLRDDTALLLVEELVCRWRQLRCYRSPCCDRG